REIDAVERAFAPFVVEECADFVAHERAAKADVLRTELAVALQVNRRRGNVVRLFALTLNLVMFGDGVLANDEFRDGVRKTLVFFERNVAFRDRDLAVLAEDNQVARMVNRRRLFGRRNKYQMNRRLYDFSTRHGDKRSVADERRV